MEQSQITIPKNALVDLLRTQPKEVLLEVFEDLLVSWDDSPLSTEESVEIENAKSEFLKNETIKWQK